MGFNGSVQQLHNGTMYLVQLFSSDKRIAIAFATREWALSRARIYLNNICGKELILSLPWKYVNVTLQCGSPIFSFPSNLYLHLS